MVSMHDDGNIGYTAPGQNNQFDYLNGEYANSTDLQNHTLRLWTLYRLPYGISASVSYFYGSGQRFAASIAGAPFLVFCHDDVVMDPARIAQELALMADRLDCTEECVRLSAHLDQFRSLMEGPELAGRKLNFLLQEMNREANTIGSKANDVEIAHAVVVIKDEVERLREQVQNVE